MKEEENPLVSCIMPTYNRRAFVPYAIQYFLRQDYPHKELIIIDDGNDQIEDLVPDNPMIRYYRLDIKHSLGAKLNIGCTYARGKIIAHWDDDDWYAVYRLSYQVQSLQEEKIYISGINRLLYYDLRNKQALQYIYPGDQRIWLSGSSLCYKKDFWLQNHFEDINVGMDGLFVWKTTPEHLNVLKDSTFAVHMLHTENGSPKDTSGTWWKPGSVKELQNILREDWPNYSNGTFSAPANIIETKSKLRSSAEEDSVRECNPTSFKNVFSCLVHENIQCILDLVQNLQFYDPSSIILLYNGGNEADLLKNTILTQTKGVFIHPNPEPVQYGYLHDSTLSCMQFALDNFDFDFLTTVDSDQLLLRENYSEYIGKTFSENPSIGMLSSESEKISVPDRTKYVASEALKEYELWKPLLQSFPDGENKFVYWTFWPSTVFSAKAVKDLLTLFKENELLKNIMQQTKIWGTEEVILPTLTSLLGYEILLTPCSQDYVRYKETYSVENIEAAFQNPLVFWVHPIERELENPLRKFIRQQSSHYQKIRTNANTEQSELMSQQALLKKIEKIEGSLSDKEADLLIATILKACIDFQEQDTIVEMGGGHGKSTLLFGSILKSYFPARKLYSIDSPNGKFGAEDKGLQTYSPRFESFKKNIKEAGISDFVQIIKDYSFKTKWQQSIALLHFEGIQTYENQSGGFRHFEDSIIEGGYIILQDYFDQFPEARKFVNELLATGNYFEIQRVENLLVIQKQKPQSIPKVISLQMKEKEDFPKIIHQSWKNEHIPFDIYKEHWVNSWKINHPDWEYKLWTDAQNEELVKNFYPQFYDFYMSLNPAIKKADFSRFLYMHKYGGVYADLDFISLKNISPLLENYDLVLGRMSPDNDYYQIPNAFMASRCGNDFWLQVAKDAQNAPPEEQSVEKQAGPFRLQWAYEKYQPENSIVYDHKIIYPFDWINFTDWNNGKYYREDKKQLAEQLQYKSLDEIGTVFPEAYCLTFWTHNW